MTLILNSHLGLSRSLRSNDLGWLNFEVATSKVWHCFSKFGSSPRKGKVDLCTTNGSKVMIYLTLQYFKFYCTHVSNAKGNIAKSNKSELWNRLSYRGLPYLFEVRSQTLKNNITLSRSRHQNLTNRGHSTSMTSKGHTENKKKCHRIIPFFP